METGNRAPLALTSIVLVALLVMMSNCGGGSDTPPLAVTPPATSGGVIITITIAPGSTNVLQGGTQSFTATVTGATNTAVTWSIQEGTAGGSITNAGSYTAPNSAGTFHVVATSQADPTKSATATVIVPQVAVSISPGTAFVLQSGSQPFTASVTGAVNTALAWTVQEGAAGGSVTGGGAYTAPNAAGTFHVIATSQADPAKSASATITVPQVTVSLSPPSPTVLQGGTQPFTATVTGTANPAVAWSVQEGAAGGSITNTGTYTAPIQAGIFHVVVASQSDPTKSATAQVQVPSIYVYLSNTNVTIEPGNQFPFVANVSGAFNTNVTWEITEGAAGGVISPAGQYTAPGNTGTFHVVARSVADVNQTAAATVVVAPLVVTLFPTSDVLGPLGVRFFQATVNSSLNPNVTWAVQEGLAGGTVDNNGAYRAPNLTSGTFHVIATSVQNPAKSATAAVTMAASGFRPTGDMNFGRTAATATLLQNGKVLVAGGDACFFSGYYYYYGTCPLASAEIYDPTSGTFTATGQMTRARVFHTATLLSNGKVLVAGGFDAVADLYDAAAQTFAPTGSMSAVRDSHTATLLPNGKVLIAGGQNNNGSLATAELYDPAAGTFTATGAMAVKRRSHTATLLGNGKVLITGGYDGSGVVATAELYDPAAGTFTGTGAMTGARSYHSATLLANGNVLIAGGIDNSNNSLATAEIYDAVAGTFSATGTMITNHDAHFALRLGNGTVLLAGGLNSFIGELYDPVAGTFSQTGGMETWRAFPAAVLLQNGRVLVCGGSDTNWVEIYQ